MGPDGDSACPNQPPKGQAQPQPERAPGHKVQHDERKACGGMSTGKRTVAITLIRYDPGGRKLLIAAKILNLARAGPIPVVFEYSVHCNCRPKN